MVRCRKRTVFKLLLLTIPALIIMALCLPVSQDSLPVNSNSQKQAIVTLLEEKNWTAKTCQIGGHYL